MRRGHGALIAVIAGARPAELADGVPLANPLDLLGAVEAHARQDSSDTLGRLLAYAEFLEGVLSTDGITVFSDDGRLLGYNSFVRQQQDVSAAPRSLVGGARRRAFDVLCRLVDDNVLVAAFMRSSDGRATMYARSDNGRR